MLQLTEITRRDKYNVAYRFKATGDISSYFWRKHFVVTYDIPVAEIPDSILALPFIGAVLSAALVCGDTIHVPVIDHAFAEAFPQIVEAFREQYDPPLQLHTELIAAETETVNSPRTSPHRVAALFSGGLDSTATFCAHRKENPLLITIIGSDMEYDNKGKADLFRNYQKGFADVHGTTHTYVRTNARRMISRIITENLPSEYRDFWTCFQYGPLQILHAAPLLWYYNIPVLHVAASDWPGIEMPSSSTIKTDNLYRWGETKVHHSLYEMDRVDKLKLVDEVYRDIGEIYPLRICYRQDEVLNCSHCQKCLMSIVIFRAMDVDLKAYGFHYDEDALVQLYTAENIRAGKFPTSAMMLQKLKPSLEGMSAKEKAMYEELLRAPTDLPKPPQELRLPEYNTGKKIKIALKKAINRLKK